MGQASAAESVKSVMRAQTRLNIEASPSWRNWSTSGPAAPRYMCVVQRKSHTVMLTGLRQIVHYITAVSRLHDSDTQITSNN